MKKARDGKRKAELEKIKTALYDYFFDAGCFPGDLPECGEKLELGNMIYLPNFPCDPKRSGYGYQTEDDDCSQWFKVLANLENFQDSGIEKAGCQSGCGSDCEYNYGVSSSNIRINDGCVVYYACTPSGECAEFEDPFISECPRIFENDPTCEEACDEKENRCHDQRGKRIPD